jgi:pimeloyl-ACP methyl ester carboxylesterase
MPKVKVGDVSMYYETQGKGEPFVLIPGLDGDISQWSILIPLLSTDYQIIAIDNPGNGQSNKPDIHYSIDMMAGDLAGLLNTLGIGAAHILGVSSGGIIAQSFALNYPKKVMNLILGCTTFGGPYSINKETAGNSVDPIRKAVGKFDTYDRLVEIKVPTLVIAGDADKVIDSENSRLVASRIPFSELVILKGMGHGFFTEAPEETSQLVIDFLKRYPVNVGF